jgi:hypothetical protein
VAESETEEEEEEEEQGEEGEELGLEEGEGEVNVAQAAKAHGRRATRGRRAAPNTGGELAPNTGGEARVSRGRGAVVAAAREEKENDGGDIAAAADEGQKEGKGSDGAATAAASPTEEVSSLLSQDTAEQAEQAPSISPALAPGLGNAALVPPIPSSAAELDREVLVSSLFSQDEAEQAEQARQPIPSSSAALGSEALVSSLFSQLRDMQDEAEEAEQSPLQTMQLALRIFSQQAAALPPVGEVSLPPATLLPPAPLPFAGDTVGMLPSVSDAALPPASNVALAAAAAIDAAPDLPPALGKSALPPASVSAPDLLLTTLVVCATRYCKGWLARNSSPTGLSEVDFAPALAACGYMWEEEAFDGNGRPSQEAVSDAFEQLACAVLARMPREGDGSSQQVPSQQAHSQQASSQQTSSQQASSQQRRRSRANGASAGRGVIQEGGTGASGGRSGGAIPEGGSDEPLAPPSGDALPLPPLTIARDIAVAFDMNSFSSQYERTCMGGSGVCELPPAHSSVGSGEGIRGMRGVGVGATAPDAAALPPVTAATAARAGGGGHGDGGVGGVGGAGGVFGARPPLETPSSVPSAGNLDRASRVAGNTLEGELRRVLPKQAFRAMQVLGQFNLGFLVARRGSDLFIVDQHAADEKARFEALQKSTLLHTQRLIAPLPLHLTAVDELTVRVSRSEGLGGGGEGGHVSESGRFV